MKDNILFQRLEALVATGMPGAYKILIFFLLQKKFGLDALGEIASWISTAQILGFFTAIGWGSLILIRVPKLDCEEEKKAEFFKLFIMSITTLTIACTATISIGIIGKQITTAINITLWLVAWSIYQTPRHYLIAEKRYRAAILLDTLVIIISIISLASNNLNEISLLLSIAMTAPGLILLHTIRPKKLKPCLIRFEKKGLEFGLINLLSGGISLSLIPLANHFEGKEFSGCISLFVSTAAIAALIPRAIALSSLSTISRHIKSPKNIQKTIQDAQKSILNSNILTIIGMTIFSALFMINGQHQSISPVILAASFLLILTQNLANQKSLIASNILMALEDSKKSLKANGISFLVFTTSILISIFIKKYEYISILLILTATSIVRERYISACSKKMIRLL
ncbi:hypothetical protein [Pseudomonas nicosulfuronedens]